MILITKLVDDDKPIFLQLIQDMFPEFQEDTKRKFDKVLKEKFKKLHKKNAYYKAEDIFILKCVELAELFASRHSVFIIGPASTCEIRSMENIIRYSKLYG